MGHSRARLQHEHGATMIEHAMILPIFLLLILTVVDLCYFSFNALTLQFGISRAMRAAAIDPTMTPNQVRVSIANAMSRLGVTLEAQDRISLCPVTSAHQSCGENDIINGDEHELMVLRIKKRFRSLFIDFVGPLLTLNAEAVGRNEPL
ncbi:MAG: TadE/TadG family type IV pilus assembly protein [Bdellovibrionota bacterium]